jgi:hypothetical protein
MNMAELPGWNSVDEAALWGTIFHVLGLVALGLLVVFNVLAYVYGNRKDTLVAAEQTVRNQQEEQKRKANEAALSDLQEQLRNAQEQNGVIAQQLGQSSQKVSELEKKTEDRAITPEQKAALISVLAANPKYKITVTCNMGDQESLRFAQQFMDVFKQSGWIVDGPNQAMYDRAPVGIQLTIRDGKNPPPGALTIVNALKEVRIEFGAFQNPSVAEGIIDFRVGSKP